MKKFKKLGIMLGCICIVVFLLQYNMSISRFVKRNYVDLEQFVDKIQLEEEGEQQKEYVYKGWNVTRWESNGMVEFMKASWGIGSSTTYKGFYYSPNNEPLGFQGSQITFQKEGKGWKWKEEEGDNWEYTERIMENWFQFEIHF